MRRPSCRENASDDCDLFSVHNSCVLERSVFRSPRSLMGSLWVVPAIINEYLKYCGWCGGGRALGGGIYKDFKVAENIFGF